MWKKVVDMSIKLSIPNTKNAREEIFLNFGDTIFILGANGTGKSALIHKFRLENRNAKLISAHRQIWFQDDTNSLSLSRKRQIENMISVFDSHPDARWKDNHAGERPNLVIFDLISKINTLSREIADAVRQKNCGLAKKLSETPSPLDIINDLLRLSNIPIKISIDDNEAVNASKKNGPKYSISQLSDGERSALLIAANVLTAPKNSLLIIDEPERHLHRSITSPLLTQLFAQRDDCAFIVSTHDVTLPLDSPRARTILLRECNFVPSAGQTWDFDLVPDSLHIDDSLKRDILGGRQILLFVEGNEGSLDKLLYSRLFPQVSVIPKSTCGDVERAVRGIRGAKEFHWLHVFGIVDKDQRSDEDIRRLKEENIYAVPFVSVEAIFYHPEIQTQMARQQGESLDMNWEELLEKAKTDSILAVTNNGDHLVKGAVEARIRSMLMAKLPTRKDVTEDGKIELEISFKKEIVKEKGKLEELCKNQNFEGILESYPIRESAALDKIAQALRYQRRKDYESAVLARLSKDEETLSFVRSLFGDLASQMESAASPASATSSS
jgi:hypothetical protein